MESIIDKLEFGNVKLLRKNLLVTSAIGIIVSQFVKYSTGDIGFFGFTIPSNNAPILNKLVWFIVLYFFIALVIRLYDENFQKKYNETLDLIRYTKTYRFGGLQNQESSIKEAQETYIKSIKGKDKFRKNIVFVYEIIVPLIMGLIALILCFDF